MANAEVTSWLEGAEGVSAHAVDEADTFMASISGVPPEAGDIMQEAGPFGALQEQLHADEWGARAASGMPLKFQLTRATRPWIELLHNGSAHKRSAVACEF